MGYKALWAMVGTLLLAVAVISFRFYQASPGTVAGATTADSSQTGTVQENQSDQDLRLADRRLLLAELIADGQQQIVDLDQVISVFATELSDRSSMEPVAMRDWQVELARAYRLIGSDDASIAMFEQALQPIAGVDTNMFDLADVDLERIQFMLDRDELSAAEKALSSGPLSRLPDNHEMSATRLLMLGTLQLGQQRYQEAEQTLLNLMTADSVNPAEGSDETRASMKQQAKSLLAKTYHNQGRYRQAVRHRQQLLDTALADGSGRIDILQLRHDLADSLVGAG